MIPSTWEGLFSAVDELVLPERSYPYSYQDLPLIKLFVYARLKGIIGFQSLQKHLANRSDVLALVGLEKAPHRKTIAARFRALAASVSSLLQQLTEQVIKVSEVDASIGSVDSTLMHAHGNVWHKKQRDQGELPSCGNVDQEAHWGKSGCGEVVPALAGVLVDLTVGVWLPPACPDALWSRRYDLAYRRQRPAR